MKPRLLLNNPALQGFRRRLDEEFETVALWEFPDLQALMQAPGGSPKAMMSVGGVSRAQLNGLTPLELIVTLGAGYDGIDLALARERGVQVANCPGVNSADVADHAIALMLALVKNLVPGDHLVRSGGWSIANRGRVNGSLKGRKVGILGFGAIGVNIADRLHAFGCDISWWGPRPKDTVYRRAEDLPALARDSDILFVALRVDASNQGIVSREILDALGPKGLLINVSRGAAVDEDALIAALKEGRLGAAGLDVFTREPTPAERWAEVPNTLLTPHTGGNTRDSLLNALEVAKANLHAFYAGQPVLTPVPYD